MRVVIHKKVCDVKEGEPTKHEIENVAHISIVEGSIRITTESFDDFNLSADHHIIGIYKE